MQNKVLILSLVSILTIGCCKKDAHTMSIVSHHVDFSHVQVQDSFWSPRLQRVATTTIPVCIDQTEVQTGRIRNFENAAHGEGQHSGIYFDDSDVYKALEAIAYSLINRPDSAMEAKADDWIQKIAAAQQADGYINTYYTLTGLSRRWSDMDKHEMYCAGHLIEAGVAYQQATGKTTLLEVGQRMADHIMSVFNEQGRHWVPGHEELELAMVKLYEATQEDKYLHYAEWLLSQRGHGYGQYDSIDGTLQYWNAAYYQDLVPVADLRNISGHAVRAMYLLCGMCDVAARMPQTHYQEALDSVWEDVVKRNMYITGGIGVAYCSEAFAGDYELPNKEAYCETCASVGMALWNSRMNERTGDAKYMDVLERSVYNAMLAGINLDGNLFFYVNPLASDGNHHRKAWYGCACCPSNISRFMASIGNYIYATSDTALYLNLFIGNQAEFKVGNEDVSLALETSYPWIGMSTLTFQSKMKKTLMVRIPDWCKECSMKVNGERIHVPTANGYAIIQRKWKKGDQLAIFMDMPTRMVAADPRVKADEGRRAIQRGPLVYCAEQVDNSTDIEAITISDSTHFTEQYAANTLGGIIAIDAQENEQTYRLIPYYAWDNRAPGKMAVWLPFKDDGTKK